MNNDYEIKFKFACQQDSKTLDQLMDQFIATVERTHSYAGGGCGPREGGFFVETGEAFKPKDLQALLAIWLPHAKNLNVKIVAKETPKPKAQRPAKSKK
jgi:uncharacterized protein YggL (DUF469 family)